MHIILIKCEYESFHRKIIFRFKIVAFIINVKQNERNFDGLATEYFHFDKTPINVSIYTVFNANEKFAPFVK